MSSTKTDFIASHIAAKVLQYLQRVLKQLGYDEKDPTEVHNNDISALHIINRNTSPTDHT